MNTIEQEQEQLTPPTRMLKIDAYDLHRLHLAGKMPQLFALVETQGVPVALKWLKRLGIEAQDIRPLAEQRRSKHHTQPEGFLYFGNPKANS